MKLMGAVLFLVAVVGAVAGEERRPPSPQELAAGLKTSHAVAILDGGQVVDQVSVSPDGQWLVYAYFQEDIHSNHLRMVAIGGGQRKEIDAPRGFKNTPVVSTNRLLYFTLDSPPGAKLPDGIYYGPWDGSPDRWRRFETGSFRDLAFSADGRFLAASTGNFDRANVRSTVRVWEVGATGAKAGEGYTVGTGVAGQVRQITWGTEGLVFEVNVEKAGEPWGQSNLYTAENRPRAPAQLLRERARDPVWGSQRGFPVLYFNEGDWRRSRLMALSWEDRRESLVATLDNREGEGLTANGMAWDPVGRRLVLGVQASATTAGLVAFPPP